MRPARIKKLKAAANQLQATNYEAAFALRWIAYEGTIVRAVIKALWLRGSTVKDAEGAISLLGSKSKIEGLNKLLAQACGIAEDKITSPILYKMIGNRDLRNLLFHQSTVVSKSRMQTLSAEIARFLDNPSLSLSPIMVRTGVLSNLKFASLGDPFADLRNKKRPNSVPKSSAKELLPDYF